MTPHRRSTDHVVVRCFQFVTAPLVDGNSGRLSITRCLAVFDTILAGHIIEEHHPLSGTVLTLLIMAMAAAFGKSTFGFFLTRYEMKASVAATVNDTHTVTETINRQIVERRDASSGTEPTP